MENFKKFKKKVLHDKDDLFAIFCINPLTVRFAYLVKKYKWDLTANQVSYLRLFFLGPLIVSCLLLAPLFQLKVFYLLSIFFSYLFLLTDWLDGQIARGTNTTSEKGAFLDSVADRFSTIIFMVLLVSGGLWFNNLFLVCLAIFLFVLKTFHLMVITKVFYYGLDDGKENAKVFAGNVAFNTMGLGKVFSLFQKMNKVLKIKRWGGNIGGSDRYVLTIIFPLILIFFNFNFLALFNLYLLVSLFLVFFVIRIKNLFRDELK